jgi:hypothetical protein
MGSSTLPRSAVAPISQFQPPTNAPRPIQYDFSTLPLHTRNVRLAWDEQSNQVEETEIDQIVTASTEEPLYEAATVDVTTQRTLQAASSIVTNVPVYNPPLQIQNSASAYVSVANFGSDIENHNNKIDKKLVLPSDNVKRNSYDRLSTLSRTPHPRDSLFDGLFGILFRLWQIV